MKKGRFPSLSAIYLIALALVAFLSSCSPPLHQSQLLFGIQAAGKDLWEEAIFRWKKVIKVDPDSAPAHNNLAVAYEKKGLFEEARKEYEIALNLNPDNKYIRSNYEQFKKTQAEKNEKDKN